MARWPLVVLAVAATLHLRYVFHEEIEKDEETIEWTIGEDKTEGKARYQSNCTFSSCLDVRVAGGEGRLRVWLQPLLTIRDESGTSIVPPPSREFLLLRSVIRGSEWPAATEDSATLVVPGVDFLNLGCFRDAATARRVADEVKKRLSSGRRALIFSFLGRGILPEDSAVLASAQPIAWRFRHGFDVALPMWEGLGADESPGRGKGGGTKKTTQAAVFMGREDDRAEADLRSALAPFEVVFLKRCEEEEGGGEDKTETDGPPHRIFCDDRGRRVNTRSVLESSSVVIVDDRLAGSENSLMEAVRSGAVPVIVGTSGVRPFEEALRWESFSVSVPSSSLLRDTLRTLLKDPERLESMRSRLARVHAENFADLSKIVATTLRILEARLVPHRRVSQVKENEGESIPLPWLESDETRALAVIAGDAPSSLLHRLVEARKIGGIAITGNNDGNGDALPISLIHWPGSSLSNPSVLLFRALSSPWTAFIFIRPDALNEVEATTIDRVATLWRASPATAHVYSTHGDTVDWILVHKLVVDAAYRAGTSRQASKSRGHPLPGSAEEREEDGPSPDAWTTLTRRLLSAATGRLLVTRGDVLISAPMLARLPRVVL